jgi:hypothetical protein
MDALTPEAQRRLTLGSNERVGRHTRSALPRLPRPWPAYRHRGFLERAIPPRTPWRRPFRPRALPRAHIKSPNAKL